MRLSALPNAALFLDSSFVDRRELPRKLWRTLASRQIGITPLVWGELQSWVKDPFANGTFRDLLVSAKSQGAKAVFFPSRSEWNETTQRAAEYYIQLLSVRKRIGPAFKQYLEQQLGRTPTADEVMAEVQRAARDRGIVIAKKGFDEITTPNFLADEELVVTAFFHAILTGRETVVLTRDEDVYEQFFKMIFLIDTHYRCLNIARAYNETPENLIPESLPALNSDLGPFQRGENLALHIPPRFTEWVLPRKSTWVTLTCFKFSGFGSDMRITGQHFLAEREMTSIIEQKGRDGSRSSDLLRGKNLHLAVPPTFPNVLSGDAVIALDRTVNVMGTKLSLVDMDYSVREVERRAVVEIETDLPRIRRSLFGTTVAPVARLSVTCPRPPRNVETADVESGIRVLNPWVSLLLDETFLRAKQTATFVNVLLARRFLTTSHIKEALARGDGEEPDGLRPHVLRGHEHVGLLTPDWEPLRSWGYDYYLSLLAFRKLYWKVIKERVRHDHRRESPDKEWPLIAEHYAGAQGRRLAEEGWRRQGDKGLFLGEELLVQGLIGSIFYGRGAVFLTCDPLFVEQFTKLVTMLREHYCAVEFGRKYVANPERFPVHPTKDVMGFEGDVLRHDLGLNWRNTILPRNPYQISVECWLVETSSVDTIRLSASTFLAERPMHNLLRIKGATGGLNVEGLDGQNIRLLRGRTSSTSAVIGNEKRVTAGSVHYPSDSRPEVTVDSLPWWDLAIAVRDDETTAKA